MGLEFNSLLGKTLKKIDGMEKGSDKIIFYVEGEEKPYILFHIQDCCESVQVEDVCGDPKDLIGVPLIQAEEVNNYQPELPYKGDEESYKWTFYKLATSKGYVTIRWLGETSSCYAIDVSFDIF